MSWWPVNYYNASPVVLDRVKQITGKDFRFYQRRHDQASRTWRRSSPSARTSTPSSSSPAYKAVGESVSKPIEYYYNNLNCTLVILDVMRRHNCQELRLQLLGHRLRRPRQRAHH